MASGDHLISAEGKSEAEAELAHRREVRRPEIVAAIKVAREFGDLKENAEYHAAREEQGLNEARIRVLEHHLASATVGDESNGDLVAVGTRVSYRDDANGETVSVTLVHPLEADLTSGKISVDSPIARALRGNRKGDRVTLETRRGAKTIEILELG